MDWVLRDAGALLAAVVVAVPIWVLAWATGVLIAEWMRHRGYQREMPGWVKGGILVVTAATAFASIVAINAIWGRDTGTGIVIACWMILCLGLVGALYGAPRRRYWERGTWNLRQVMVLTGVIMIIGLPLSFIDVYDKLKPEDGKIVIAQVKDGIVSTPLGDGPLVDRISVPSWLRNKVTVETKPWYEEATVGPIMPFGVTVFNYSGKTITDLEVELTSGEGYALEDDLVVSLASLTPNSHWGEVFLNVRMLQVGDQTVEFTLSYVEEGTGENKTITSLWKGPVSGPVVEVKRSIFTDRDLIAGQVVHVWLLVKNISRAPAFGLTVEPNLGSFFEAVGAPMFPSILMPQEEYLATYRSEVIAPGGLSLDELKPRITFGDAAGNTYGEESVEVRNYLCPASDECSPRDGISIAPLEPDAIPPVSVGAPAALFVDQSILQIQIKPGEAQPQDLLVHHDSERPQLVRVRPTEGRSRFLVGFDTTVLVPPGEEFAIPGSLSVPPDTELGVYQPALEVQLLTQDGRPIGIPRRVPFRLEVTQVHIAHGLPTRVITMLQEISITTTIINYGGQVATIRFRENFPRGGMTVTANLAGPVGQGRGSEGNFYFKQFTLQPGEATQRTFQVQATDNVPPVKLLEGTVSYTLEDGTIGSASHIVRFIVDAPQG